MIWRHLQAPLVGRLENVGDPYNVDFSDSCYLQKTRNEYNLKGTTLQEM